MHESILFLESNNGFFCSRFTTTQESVTRFEMLCQPVIYTTALITTNDTVTNTKILSTLNFETSAPPQPACENAVGHKDFQMLSRKSKNIPEAYFRGLDICSGARGVADSIIREISHLRIAVRRWYNGIAALAQTLYCQSTIEFKPSARIVSVLNANVVF